MKVAINIDKVLTERNGRLLYASILPAINASKRKAEILFCTDKFANLIEPEKIALLLDSIPGEASVILGHPQADIYLGV